MRTSSKTILLLVVFALFGTGCAPMQGHPANPDNPRNTLQDATSGNTNQMP